MLPQGLGGGIDECLIGMEALGIRCAFCNDRAAALETGERLAEDDVTDAELGVEAAGDARDDGGIWCEGVDQELHISCHVHIPIPDVAATSLTPAKLRATWGMQKRSLAGAPGSSKKTADSIGKGHATAIVCMARPSLCVHD